MPDVMTESPLLFNGPMIRAILDGSKTLTRRIMKPQPEPTPDTYSGPPGHWWPSKEVQSMVHVEQELQNQSGGWGGLVETCSPYGQPGARIWVRETCRAEELPSGADGVRYFADMAFSEIEDTRSAADDWLKMHSYRGKRGATVPSIHMPRWASRIDLLIKSVRVERLQNISEADCWAEGIEQVDGLLDDLAICNMAKHMGLSFEDPAPTFAALWESINGAGSWQANPWVWVIGFERIHP